MTLDEAKKELLQIRAFYNRIAERKRRLGEIRAQMMTIKISRYGGIGTAGATAKDKYRLEGAIDGCTKLEQRISDDILAMAAAQQLLIEKIEKLPEPYSNVLARYYIHMDRFERIAVDTHYSYRQVRRIHLNGLRLYAAQEELVQ